MCRFTKNADLGAQQRLAVGDDTFTIMVLGLLPLVLVGAAEVGVRPGGVGLQVVEVGVPDDGEVGVDGLEAGVA